MKKKILLLPCSGRVMSIKTRRAVTAVAGTLITMKNLISIINTHNDSLLMQGDGARYILTDHLG